MLCLCVLCKYVNGNVYFKEKIHHKAYEFVRRLLSNIHGRMLLSRRLVLTYTRALSRESITCSGEVYGILLRERRSLSR